MAEKEYIEREALLEDIEKSVVISARSEDKANAEMRGVRKILDRIKSAPTADVVEVVYGEWIEHEWAEEENGLLISNFECSACHNWKRKRSDYCPNCGAKMDGKVLPHKFLGKSQDGECGVEILGGKGNE